MNIFFFSFEENLKVNCLPNAEQQHIKTITSACDYMLQHKCKIANQKEVKGGEIRFCKWRDSRNPSHFPQGCFYHSKLLAEFLHTEHPAWLYSVCGAEMQQIKTAAIPTDEASSMLKVRAIKAFYRLDSWNGRDEKKWWNRWKTSRSAMHQLW